MAEQNPTDQAEKDLPLTFRQYSAKALGTAIYPFAKFRTFPHGMERAVHYCLEGLANETGEALGKHKKALRDDIKEGEYKLSDERREQILDEIGDSLWYASEAARQLGSSLEECARKNYAKLKDRADRGALGGSGDKR